MQRQRMPVAISAALGDVRLCWAVRDERGGFRPTRRDGFSDG